MGGKTGGESGVPQGADEKEPGEIKTGKTQQKSASNSDILARFLTLIESR